VIHFKLKFTLIIHLKMMKIGTYNILARMIESKGMIKVGHPLIEFDERADKLTEVIESNDICGLQEVDAPFVSFWKKRVQNNENCGQYFIPHNKQLMNVLDVNPDDVVGFVNAIYIKNAEQIVDFGSCITDEVGRTCLWIQTTYGYFFTTHLPYREGGKKRTECLDIIFKLIASKCGGGGDENEYKEDFWLTGDFNLFDDCEYTIPIKSSFVERNLVNATEGKNTWHGFPYEPEQYRKPMSADKTLDYILSNLTCNSVEVIANELSSGVYAGLPASDHYAVSAIYETVSKLAN
jgi:endonuclease/exonuclease/phosphatase family metal-dependent hydrolase